MYAYRAALEAADEPDALTRFAIPAEIEALLRADFTLGGNVRNVSFGEYGARVRWDFDEEEVAGSDRPDGRIDGRNIEGRRGRCGRITKKAVAEAPDVDSVRAAGTVIDWGL